MNSQQFPKINFIGNKEKLAEWICDFIPSGSTSFFDAFSGGSSIGYEAKKRGLKVISNDVQKINYLIAKSLIENNNIHLNENDIKMIFTGNPIKGFMFNNYSNIYYHPSECMELDLYHANIEKLKNPYKSSLAYLLIRRAMIRKMPYSRFTIPWKKIVQLRDEDYSYLKYGRKRAYHNQTFKDHFLENLNDYNNAIFDNQKRNKAYNQDVFNLLSKIKADVIYLDPPYPGTMNDYYGFYGIFDEYIDSKKYSSFGNNFMNREESIILLEKLFSNLGNYQHWILSYNNSSFPSKEVIMKMLSKFSKKVTLAEKDHLYKVTGKEKKKINKEYLFIVEA